MILLALVLMVTTVSAAEPQADLNVTKVVSSTGPYAVNDTVTWIVTVWNNGPDDASDIILKEDISQLSGHGDITVEVDAGTYDDTTGNLDNSLAGKRFFCQPHPGNKFQHTG